MLILIQLNGIWQVLTRMKQYKDDLVVSCLNLLLSLPNELVEQEIDGLMDSLQVRTFLKCDILDSYKLYAYILCMCCAYCSMCTVWYMWCMRSKTPSFPSLCASTFHPPPRRMACTVRSSHVQIIWHGCVTMQCAYCVVLIADSSQVGPRVSAPGQSLAGCPGDLGI